MSELQVGHRPNDNFTMISNDFARNPDISMRAKVLYLYLMSHAAGWKLSVKAAQNATGMGRGTVYSAISDLRKLGYVRRVDLKDENGYFSGTRYQVLPYPLPEDERDDVDGKTASRVPENEKPENQAKREESAAHVHFPKSSIPESSIPENVTHKKNNSKKINDQEEQYKKHMLIPDGKSDNASLPLDGIDAPGNDTPSSQKKTGAGKYPADFLEWYAMYPRKKAKGDALKAYRAARKEIGHLELMEKTRKYVRYVEQWQMEQKFIPYPASWLRASRWEDELETPHAAPGSYADGRKASALDIVREMIAKDAHGQNGATPRNAGHKELDW